MNKSPTYKSQTFTGIVCKKADGNNAISYNYLSQRQMFLNNMKNGQDITDILTDKKPLRTTQQNNYYWLYLSLVALSSGHTSNELHLWAKGKFLTEGITEIFGDKVRVVDSTTKLNKAEFCEYICRIEDATDIEAPTTEPFLKPLTHNEFSKLREEQRGFYQRMISKIFICNKQ